MALGTFLGLNLVTPRGVVAHQDTDSVRAPGELGEFELLPGHVPMLTALKPGVLTIGTKRTRYAISSGYLRVDPNGEVEILVEQAMLAKDVDVEGARKDLSTAESDLSKWGDKPHDGDYTNMKARVDWARARIDAATSAS